MTPETRWWPALGMDLSVPRHAQRLLTPQYSLLEMSVFAPADAPDSEPDVIHLALYQGASRLSGVSRQELAQIYALGEPLYGAVPRTAGSKGPHLPTSLPQRLGCLLQIVLESISPHRQTQEMSRASHGHVVGLEPRALLLHPIRRAP